MIIRNYTKSDEDFIQELAKKHDVSIPNDGLVLVAESSEGKIVGFILIRTVSFIEPFVCENKVTAVELFNEAILHLKTMKAPIVRAIIGHEHLGVAGKVGFEKIFTDKILIEKLVPDLTRDELTMLKERNLLKNKNIN